MVSFSILILLATLKGTSYWNHIRTLIWVVCSSLVWLGIKFFLLFLFSHWVVSNSLWPRGLQHTRLPCTSVSPGVCSNSCPLSQWCCLTILCPAASSSSSCPQSFPAAGSFPVSWLFTSGSQNIGALASGLPLDIQGWFPLGLTGLTSLLSVNSMKRHIFYSCLKN